MLLHQARFGPCLPGPSPTRVESEPEPAMHRRPHRRQGEGVPLFAALDILFEANTIADLTQDELQQRIPDHAPIDAGSLESERSSAELYKEFVATSGRRFVQTTWIKLWKDTRASLESW